MPESIKAKSVHDLTPEDEVALENDLLGLDVEHQSVEMDIEEDMDENGDDDIIEEEGYDDDSW